MPHITLVFRRFYCPFTTDLIERRLIFLIELLTQFVRPFALTIRLFANMMGGHVVILAFISLIFILGWYVFPVSVGLALFVNFLEIMVGFLQAYIFTVLTANFIGMSVHVAH